jgi:hypothetical protein
VKEQWRNASAPPSVLSARLLRVFLIFAIYGCDVVFNWLISRLVSDQLMVSAECPVKRYIFMFIYMYIVSYQPNEH